MITFTPSLTFPPGQTVRLRALTGIKDLYGNTFAGGGRR